MTAFIRLACAATALGVLVAGTAQPTTAQDDGWVSIFDGKSLDGWKVGENAQTFSVENGELRVFGPRAHLYYVGPVANHNFTNFEWKADIMTFPGANSGMYFHTEYQESGWPEKGYEVQVNNSHTDRIRTGSLYNIVDVTTPPAKDHEWFTQHIVVRGKRVTISVNGKQLVDYTEPDNVERPASMKGRVLSSGTFAIQGHDPKSRVHYKNIMVKVLP
jgi:hypothetical protein